jgi:ATP-binding cassette, subfamily C, bacterial CydD
MRAFDSRLLRHASAARFSLVATVCLGFGTTGLVLAQASLLAHALAGAARGFGVGALRGTLTALAAVLVARALAAWGSEASALRAAAIVKSQLRRRLITRALGLGPAWLRGQRPGEITTLATKGLDSLDAYFARYLPQLLLSVLVPLAVLVRVTVADWISGLVIAGTLPLIPLFGVLIGLHTKARTQRQWRLLAALGGHFLDVVEGLSTLKVFGRAKAQAEIIRKVTDEHRTATMAALRVAFLSALVLELAAAIATALVAVEVGLRLLAGHIGYETALLVLLLTPEAYLPLRAIGAQFHASAEGTAAADQVMDILSIPEPAASAPPRGTARRTQVDLSTQSVVLADVSLRYPDRDAPSLADLSIVINPGAHVAITGPSGAGKSSVLGLLLRFADPTGGTITVGLKDVQEIPLPAWRRQIAWVPQRPYLFAGTVAANIALGDPDATPDAIARAARLAGAEAFISALPRGFDTALGERALTLSAGQRQRIALARAFLRDAPLVLLDEPTAHLDAATATEIMVTIETLMADRTVLLVSHGAHPNVSTVLRLDRGRLSPVTAPAASVVAADPVTTS